MPFENDKYLLYLYTTRGEEGTTDQKGFVNYGYVQEGGTFVHELVGGLTFLHGLDVSAFYWSSSPWSYRDLLMKTTYWPLI